MRRSVLREVGPAGATVEDRFSGERRLIEASLCVDAGFLLPRGHPLACVGRPPPACG